MKKLEECRAYFEDLYMDMLDTYVDSEEKKLFNMFEETIRFIYGDEYDRISARWKQDALNKYYSKKYESHHQKGVPPHDKKNY